MGSMCKTCLQDGHTLRHDGTREIPHGTYAGYKAHQNRGVEMCDECREAGRAYQRQRYAARLPPSADYTPRPEDAGKMIHGTYAGYRKHENRGTEPCDLCREAARIYRRTGNTLKDHPLTEAALSLL